MLLDECLPRRLGAVLGPHTVSTVPQAGWAGVTNGDLLARIGVSYDAFITVDKNLPAQQSIGALAFGLIVLRAPSNRLEMLAPLAPQILAALATLRPGQVVVISGP